MKSIKHKKILTCLINQAVKPVHTNPPTHTHVYDADGYAEKTSSSARHAPKYKAVGNAWNTPTFTHESNMLRAGANGPFPPGNDDADDDDDDDEDDDERDPRPRARPLILAREKV